MFKTTIRGLLAHKLRLLTSAIAIVIGVAFISGTLVLTSTITTTFNDLFANVYAGTESVARSSTVISGGDNGDQRANIDAGLLSAVRGAPGVATAEGTVQNYAQFVDHDGKAVGNPNQGAPTLAVNYTGDPKLDPFQVAQGVPPQGPDQVVMDTATATRYHFAVGDTVDVVTATGTHHMDIVGLSKFGSADGPLGATVALFDTPTAQQITGLGNTFTTIAATAQPGVSQEQLTQSIQSVLPAGNEAVTGATVVKEAQTGVQEGLSFFSTFMLVFAVVAVFVGAFVIYNTFSIIVAQRAKEMALLRAIGATRRQVLGSVLGEAAVIGFVFSVVGIVAGIGLASLLKVLLKAVGFGVPANGIVVPPSAIIVGFLTGLGVTMLVAFAPARRASKVPPVAAMRDVTLDTSASSKVRIGAGLLVLAGGLGLLFLGLFGKGDNSLLAVGGGAAITFLGVAVLGPIIAGPAARVIGAPASRFKGVTGQLARENAMRNPKRTSSTAAALMVGVGLVAFFTIFFASATASLNHTIDQEFHGDFLISSGQQGQGQGKAGLPHEVAQQLSSVPGVEAVLAVQEGSAEINGSGDVIAGVETGPIDKIADLGQTQGSFADLGADDIAVSRKYADDHHLTVGSTVPATFTDTGATDLNVAVVYEKADLVGNYFLSRDGFSAHFDQANDGELFVSAAKADLASVRTAIDDATAAYPTADVQDVSQFKAAQAEQINTVLTLVYVLLALAVVIAVLGIINTLALSIFERTRELGLMRAVGMARAQVRSSVRWESVIIALLGTGLGLVIGLFFGWAAVQALSSEGINTLAVPSGTLMVVVLLAIVAGAGAAVLPARRASRLDILAAISSD
ncbi:MAG: ABC transporter permease [Acidimicrobiales bacterium]